MKQRNASSGVLTMGSPRTLKEVLISTGQPVIAKKRSSERVVDRVGLAVHRLDAGGVVDMRHRRDVRTLDVELVDPEQRLLLAGHGAPMLRTDICDQEHVRRIPVELEPVADPRAAPTGRRGGSSP